jgi:two-component system osmolarity sensor histidine kinase EnvZ
VQVLADEVELARVISNLLENARRYGKTPETGIAVVDIAAKRPQRMGADQGARPRHGRGAGGPAQAHSSPSSVATRPAPPPRRRPGPGDRRQNGQRMGGIFALANTARGGGWRRTSSCRAR